MSSHYQGLLVEALRLLLMTISMHRPTKEGARLTVIAKYYSNAREISIKVVEEFWEREVSWPNEAHLERNRVGRMPECEKVRRTSSLRVRRKS